MILEGIVTTIDGEGSLHVAPMGPDVEDAAFERFCLRPYMTSQTLSNLRLSREGVLHVTDDVELMARAAVGQLRAMPETVPASRVRGHRLRDACRWMEFRVEAVDETEPRVRLTCQVVARGHGRDFFGFCRAKHAILELAIMATRTDHLPQAEIMWEMHRCQRICDKTAGVQERNALGFLQEYLHDVYTGQGDE